MYIQVEHQCSEIYIHTYIHTYILIHITYTHTYISKQDLRARGHAELDDVLLDVTTRVGHRDHEVGML